MKTRNLLVMSIAAAAMTFASCQKEDVSKIEECTPVSFHVTANTDGTRSVFGAKVGTIYPILWTENKQVAFSLNESAFVAADPEVASEGTSATFEVEFTNGDTEGTLYAFSPKGVYDSKISANNVPGFTSINNTYHSSFLNIPSVQTPLVNSCDESVQAIFASQAYTGADNVINMTFRSVVAYGKMQIKNFTGTISKVDLVFPVAVCGTSCHYYFAGDNEGTIDNADKSIITLNPDNVVDNVFWFACAPTAGATGEMKIIITDDNDDTYTKAIDLTTKALPFEKGKVSSFSVNFSGISKDVKESVYTWDLSKASYSSASSALVTWTSPVATMTNSKGSGTNADNYLGGTNSDSRFYKNNSLTITPGTGCIITKVVFNTTTQDYIASSWTNASTAKDANSVTVTPTDGSQPFCVTPTGTTKVTSVKVYYIAAASKSLSSIALSGTYPTEFYTGDEFSHEGMTVTATYDDATTANVTSNATFSGYDMDTPGQQTVTVTYTEVETTQTAQYTITVTATPMILADDITDIPAIGGETLEHNYNVKYFTDDVEVAGVTGQVTEAVVVDGVILYTIAPNYTTTAKNGTITLQSASNHEVSKTINVSQFKSSLSVSATELVIPYNATSATFTITSKEMGWNVTAASAENMNISVDKNSGSANNNPQTITVSSTVEASTSAVQTLGTIEVYRNGNTSDSQKKNITIKKGQAPDASTKYYIKTSTFTPGKYLFVRDNKTVTSLTSDVYMTLGAVTIADNKIASNAATDGYSFTITEVTSGKYSICYSDGNYIGYNTSTKFKKSTTAPTSSDTAFLWTVSVVNGTLKFTNVGTTKRSIAANATSNAASLRPYANDNIPSSYPLPDFYKLEE